MRWFSRDKRIQERIRGETIIAAQSEFSGMRASWKMDGCLVLIVKLTLYVLAPTKITTIEFKSAIQASAKRSRERALAIESAKTSCSPGSKNYILG